MGGGELSLESSFISLCWNTEIRLQGMFYLQTSNSRWLYTKSKMKPGFTICNDSTNYSRHFWEGDFQNQTHLVSLKYLLN